MGREIYMEVVDGKENSKLRKDLICIEMMMNSFLLLLLRVIWYLVFLVYKDHLYIYVAVLPLEPTR